VKQIKKVQAEIPQSQYDQLARIAEKYTSTVRNVASYCIGLSLEAWAENPDLFCDVPRDGRKPAESVNV
jgi:hypothetical protein